MNFLTAHHCPLVSFGRGHIQSFPRWNKANESRGGETVELALIVEFNFHNENSSLSPFRSPKVFIQLPRWKRTKVFPFNSGENKLSKKKPPILCQTADTYTRIASWPTLDCRRTIVRNIQRVAKRSRPDHGLCTIYCASQPPNQQLASLQLGNFTSSVYKPKASCWVSFVHNN